MTRSRVLVVDDHCDMADGIAMLLREAGLEVEVAGSGHAAVALLEEREFELVLSDIRMPGLGGVELLRAIRERWPRTGVVLLTAYATINSAVEAMKIGARDYLTKPFDNAALVEVVQRALAAGPAAGGFDTAAIVGEVAATLSADDLIPGLCRALEVLVRATGADDGEIFLREPEGQDVLLSAWSGPDGAALAERDRFAMGDGYPGIAVASGRPVWSRGGLADDPRYLRRAVVAAGIHSLVAAPLPDARTALGSIHLMSRRSDFPVDRVLDLLERAAVPVSNAVRAALAVLRQSVDAVCGGVDDASGELLRRLLESIRQVAGARYGTLALIDPRTGGPGPVVSTGPASIVCGPAEAGSWVHCPSVLAAHGFAADPGRRHWPESCRRGLPPRAASPCCLPLVAGGRMEGLVVLDFGREGARHAVGRLVPLLTMAQQVAIRLQARRAGVVTGPEGEAPELELRCLGPFEVLRRGVPIPAESFTRSKALVLLQLLAVRMGAPVHREVLIEQLWPEVEPQLGANRLHGVVHDLRAVIEPHRAEREWRYIRNRGDFYYLDLNAPVELDLARFRRLVAEGLRAGPGQEGDAIAGLEAALGLYRGELLADDPLAEWCEAERAELKECHAKALLRLAELQTRRGNTEEALGCLRRAERAAPYRDEVIGAKMRLLAELGRPDDALATYDDYRRGLQDEFGVGPSAALQALERHLQQTAGVNPLPR